LEVGTDFLIKLYTIKWHNNKIPCNFLTGKSKQKEEFIIPDQFLKKIVMVNNNIKRNIEENKEKNVESSPLEEKKKIDVSQICK